MLVKIGVSNRHVHLTKDAYEYLFNGKTLEKRNDLNQIGEFASTDTVDIEYGDKVIEHLRIVGPFRAHNQIELLGRDLEYLNLEAPVRRSGDLENTPTVTIKANGLEIKTDGVIRSERHLHVPTCKVEEYNLHERDKITVKTKSGSFDAFVKVSDNAFLELHIDKDEAGEYGLTSGNEVEVTPCGK